MEVKAPNLGDSYGTFAIESLSMSLYSNFSVATARVLFVQLTGTKIAHASNATGTKILSLYNQNKESLH